MWTLKLVCMNSSQENYTEVKHKKTAWVSNIVKKNKTQCFRGFCGNSYQTVGVRIE